MGVAQSKQLRSLPEDASVRIRSCPTRFFGNLLVELAGFLIRSAIINTAVLSRGTRASAPSGNWVPKEHLHVTSRARGLSHTTAGVSRP